MKRDLDIIKYIIENGYKFRTDVEKEKHSVDKCQNAIINDLCLGRMKNHKELTKEFKIVDESISGCNIITRFNLCIKGNNIELVKSFYDKNINVYPHNENLFFLIKYKHNEMFELVTKSMHDISEITMTMMEPFKRMGEYPKPKKYTLIEYAIQEHNFEIFKYLLEKDNYDFKYLGKCAMNNKNNKVLKYLSELRKKK